MRELRPCTHCRRHVDAAEHACPFCDGALTAAEPRPLFGAWRSRAAVFASSAALAAAACSKPKATTETGSGSAPISQTADATVIAVDSPASDAAVAIDAPLDAAPPVDAAVKHPRPDAAEAVRIRDHHNPKPYGAPPARRRIV